MKGLYLYKAVSPYPEDTTKDCKLTVNEIDSNFLTLKDADIKDVSYNNDTKIMTIARNNGDTIPVDLSDSFEGVVKDLDVEYDSIEGTIRMTYNDKVVTINGLLTEDNIGDDIFKGVVSDGTLQGLGKDASPLGLNPVEKTGLYKPAKKFIDVADGEQLPTMSHRAKGDRYLVRNLVSDYGLLYDFPTVNKIEGDLQGGWRVPTKADWDSMLNAIEPCDEYRNHESAIANQMLGKYAGKELKANKDWLLVEGCDGTETDDEFDVVLDGGREPDAHPVNPTGTDNFGMTLLPGGHYSDCDQYSCFKERGYYWSLTQCNASDVYTKRFDYDKAGVVQTVESPYCYHSLRFVKDYNGSNFHEYEYINGKTYKTVLMPDMKAQFGFAIWTAENAAMTKDGYNYKTPNNGEGINQRNAYYIIEWTGFGWATKEVLEGEGLALNVGLEGETNMIYRVMNGELYSDANTVKDAVLDILQPQLDEIGEQVEENTAAISSITEDVEELFDKYTELNDKVATEIEDRVNADEALQTAINDEQEARIEKYNELRDDIDTLTEVEGEHYQELSQKVAEVSAQTVEQGEEINLISEELEEVSGKIITDESSYDSVNGVLTLATEDEENTITIQFNGDYGTF